MLDGQVIAQCQQRHRHTEWLKFLRKIERETPKDKTLHLTADNYATQKHPAVQDWLDKHPRFHMPHLGSMAEHVRAVLSRHHNRATSPRRIHRVPELVDAINEYIANHNTNPKPFIWTKSARDILQKVIRANRRLSSKQHGTLH